MVVMEGGAARLVLGPGKGKRTWLGKYSSMALIPIFEGREAMIRVVTVGRKKLREGVRDYKDMLRERLTAG
jgi:hypothetical protein